MANDKKIIIELSTCDASIINNALLYVIDNAREAMKRDAFKDNNYIINACLAFTKQFEAKTK